MLNSLADFYDEEIETEVARFITLIEPVILVIMGVVIAAVVLALYMPLFELSSRRWRDRSANGNGRSEENLVQTPEDHSVGVTVRARSWRALPAGIRRHGRLPDRPGAVPIDSGRSDAALRLRAATPRGQGARHRRLRSDRPADDRRAGRHPRGRRSRSPSARPRRSSRF